MSEERVILRLPEEHIHVEKADSLYEKLKGLRFRGSGKMFFDLGDSGRALVDTVFVHGSLHLYFLDEDLEVVETKVLRPDRFYRPERDYRYLLESFKDLGLEEGDEIEKVGEVKYRRFRCGTLDYR